MLFIMLLSSYKKAGSLQITPLLSEDKQIWIYLQRYDFSLTTVPGRWNNLDEKQMDTPNSIW